MNSASLTDPLDKASIENDVGIEDSLHQVRKNLTQYNAVVKYCMNENCGELVNAPAKFCNIDCRDEYEVHLKMKRILGK